MRSECISRAILFTKLGICGCLLLSSYWVGTRATQIPNSTDIYRDSTQEFA